MRRFSDPIEVRASVRPEAFVWRGRLYVVRDVLGHWRERRAWWRDALEDPRPVPAPAPAGEQSSAGRLDAPPGRLDAAAAEAEVWRVEASAGRVSSPGIYDLRRDGDPRGAGAPAWHLVRVAD